MQEKALVSEKGPGLREAGKATAPSGEGLTEGL